jgi:DNA polymerase-4
LDLIRGRYGNGAVQRASTINEAANVNRKFKAELENDRESKEKMT